MIMVLAKYWAAERAEAVRPGPAEGGPRGHALDLSGPKHVCPARVSFSESSQETAAGDDSACLPVLREALRGTGFRQTQ